MNDNVERCCSNWKIIKDSFYGYKYSKGFCTDESWWKLVSNNIPYAFSLPRSRSTRGYEGTFCKAWGVKNNEFE